MAANTELYERLKQNSTALSEKTAIANLMLLISGLINFEPSKYYGMAVPSDDIKNTVNRVFSIIGNINNVVGGDYDVRQEYMKELKSIYKNIIDIYKNYYAETWRLLDAVVPLQIDAAVRSFSELDDIDSLNPDVNAILERCAHMLGHDDVCSEIKRQLVLCVPISMTRQIYEKLLTDSIKATINNMTIDEKNIFFNSYKAVFCERDNDVFLKNFPCMSYDTKAVFDTSKLDSDELDAVYNNILEMLSSTEYYLGDIYENINAVICLIDYGASVDELLEGNFNAKDLFLSVIELSAKNEGDIEKEAFFETIRERLDSVIEEIMDERIDLIEKQYNIINEIGDLNNLPESVEKAVERQMYMSSSFVETLNDAAFIQPKCSGDEEYIFDIVSRAMDYFNSIPPKLRRPAMRQLLSKMDVQIENDTLIQYVKLAIDNASDKARRLVIISDLITIMNSVEPRNGHHHCHCHEHGHD